VTRLKASNNATTRLVADVTATDTFFDVEDASPFPDPPFRVWVNEEIIEVGSIDRVANRFSDLVRGVENTTPAFHPVGSFVENVFTAGTYQELVDAINSVDEKIGPVEQKANQNAASILQLQQQVNAHLNDFIQHSHRHSSGGEDPITPEMIGAVSKSGDTMSGSLTVTTVNGNVNGDWEIPDTRDVPINPSDLERKVSVDFKRGNVLGLSDMYYVVFTISPWTDDSGGKRHQIALGNSGVYYRLGDSGGWGNWYRFYHEGNQPKVTVSSTAPSSPKYGDIWIEP